MQLEGEQSVKSNIFRFNKGNYNGLKVKSCKVNWESKLRDEAVAGTETAVHKINSRNLFQ